MFVCVLYYHQNFYNYITDLAILQKKKCGPSPEMGGSLKQFGRHISEKVELNNAELVDSNL